VVVLVVLVNVIFVDGSADGAFGGSVDGEDRIFVRFLKVSPSSLFRIRILDRSSYFCSTILLDGVMGFCIFRMMVVGAVAVEGAVEGAAEGAVVLGSS